MSVRSCLSNRTPIPLVHIQIQFMNQANSEDIYVHWRIHTHAPLISALLSRLLPRVGGAQGERSLSTVWRQRTKVNAATLPAGCSGLSARRRKHLNTGLAFLCLGPPIALGCRSNNVKQGFLKVASNVDENTHHQNIAFYIYI